MYWSLYVFVLLLFFSLAKTQSPTFTVNLAQTTKPFPHYWERCVGSGHALLALRTDYQRQLKMAHDLCGFEGVRFHGILDDDMSTNLGEGKYSFFNLDSAFDYFLSIGIKPIIELSFMPEWLATKDTTSAHYKGNTSPPKSYEAWGDLITALVTHLISRYGVETARQIPLEVWNEPNTLPTGFWTGTQDEYFKLVNYTVFSAKRVDKQIQVGGPVICCSFSVDWIPQLLAYAKSNNFAIDFISAHTYSDITRHSVNDILKDITLYRKAAGELPLYITEYGSSWQYDVYHDSWEVASFIAGVAEYGQGIVDIMSYWTFSDVFEEAGFPSSNIPFYSGFGMINLYGVPKPALRAFQFLHNLGTDRLEVQSTVTDTTVHVLPTLDSTHNNLIILLYNRNFDGNSTTADEQFSVIIKGTNTTAAATYQLIDKDHCNPLETWIQQGKPDYPSQKEIDEMISSSEPVPIVLSYKRVDPVTISFTMMLTGQATALVTVPLK